MLPRGHERTWPRSRSLSAAVFSPEIFQNNFQVMSSARQTRLNRYRYLVRLSVLHYSHRSFLKNLSQLQTSITVTVAAVRHAHATAKAGVPAEPMPLPPDHGWANITGPPTTR